MLMTIILAYPIDLIHAVHPFPYLSVHPQFLATCPRSALSFISYKLLT